MCQAPKMDTQRELHQVFDDHGFTGVLGTNTTAEYHRDLVPGDQITSHCVINSISEQKATARGLGYFIETLYTFTDQHGETVGTIVFRVLKFIPNDSNDALPAAAVAVTTACQKPLTASHSPRGHDNKWWWEAVDKGKVLIQRCKNCGALRHPPAANVWRVPVTGMGFHRIQPRR